MSLIHGSERVADACFGTVTGDQRQNTPLHMRVLLNGAIFLGLTAAAPTACAASPSSAGTPPTMAARTHPSTPTAPPTPGVLPTLGRQTELFTGGVGFGEVKPRGIFNGGDPTATVTDITWKSWGGPQAIGTGTGYYAGPRPRGRRFAPRAGHGRRV